MTKKKCEKQIVAIGDGSAVLNPRLMSEMLSSRNTDDWDVTEKLLQERLREIVKEQEALIARELFEIGTVENEDVKLTLISIDYDTLCNFLFLYDINFGTFTDLNLIFIQEYNKFASVTKKEQ